MSHSTILFLLDTENNCKRKLLGHLLEDKFFFIIPGIIHLLIKNHDITEVLLHYFHVKNWSYIVILFQTTCVYQNISSTKVESLN